MPQPNVQTMSAEDEPITTTTRAMTATGTPNTLRHVSPSSGHVGSTSQHRNLVPSASVSGATSGVYGRATFNSSAAYNVSASPTADILAGEDGGLSGGVVALLVCLVVLGIGIIALLVYLKVTNKLYRLLTCQTRRRSSTSSSRHPLDVDDPEDEGRREDDLPVTREVTMFTIDDFEPVQDDDGIRPGNHEEYFYDEVFGQSMFEDEITNASMRKLYTVGEQPDDDDDMFDLDTMVGVVPAASRRPSTPTTAAGRKT